jgi:alpha-amylase/alpha-mannosidase (GH57 family)
MHQPCYRVLGEAHARLPWVRLHAAKAYTDMAAALERAPWMRCSVNFSGVLAWQLRGQAQDHWQDEPWLLARTPAESMDSAQREALVAIGFSLHHGQLIDPVPRYRALRDLRDQQGWQGFSTGDLRDLQLLFNLQWCGPTVKREHGLVSLLDQPGDWSQADVDRVLEAHALALGGLAPRWRRLVERGQVEVSATPWAHPILPLLIDSDVARRSWPDGRYPDRAHRETGDARWHVEAGLREVSEWLGVSIQGMWPAEGSVSDAAAEVFAAAGVHWIATDDAVLRRSHRSAETEVCGPWQWQQSDLRLWFRDHSLSDAIGFDYAQQSALAAVDDFVARVSSRHARVGGPCAVILDGENAWESYPGQGVDFLDALYAAHGPGRSLAPVLLGALSEGEPCGRLYALHPGSWIDANFRIWIGQASHIRPWEVLVHTRSQLAQRVDGGQAPVWDHPLWPGMACAQGSDWMWWKGEDFHSAESLVLDGLFAAHLDVVEPGASARLRATNGQAREAFRDPSQRLRVTVDGYRTGHYEWVGAGVWTMVGTQGAMGRSARMLREVRWGSDGHTVYLWLGLADSAGTVSMSLGVAPAVLEPRWVCSRGQSVEGAWGRAVWHDGLEVAVDGPAMRLHPGGILNLRIVIAGAEGEGQEVWPERGTWALDPFRLVDGEWWV